MSVIANKISLAQREIRKSVIEINPHLKADVQGKNNNSLFFGVKDTNQIPKGVLEKLSNNPNYVWLTIDKASDKGRAIDTDLINPLTYRVMTGSSSGGPINILKGINDFAIGTDGGGSVLAPAMSCQLPAIIGSGVGLFVQNKKISTDQMEFIGSIGVMAKQVSILKDVMTSLVESQFYSPKKKICIAIPKRHTVMLPDQVDMYERVTNYIKDLPDDLYDFREVDMTGIDNRQVGIELINHCFQELKVDLIITCEGPVDVYGYGETIPQHFGELGEYLTRNHGKYLLRAANMCQTTAITIPINKLASGLVIIARKGMEHFEMAIDLAAKLEQTITLPEIWKRYFLENNQKFSGISF